MSELRISFGGDRDRRDRRANGVTDNWLRALCGPLFLPPMAGRSPGDLIGAAGAIAEPATMLMATHLR
jgi:hypothetical protein